MAALAARPSNRAIAWSRPDLDLDDPGSAERLLARDSPALVIHAAAWTDVDACAREPGLAMRRNAAAVDELAHACAHRGTRLVVISTNEVFDGERTDGRGYRETDAPAPRNPYGRSKLAGERFASAAFGGWSGLWVVRTSWLFGPPGGDFPDRIVAAADRLPDGTALSVVDDEYGSPSHTRDVAEGIVSLLERTDGGIFHLVNEGVASRYQWAQAVLGVRRPGRLLRPISRLEYARESEPPPWGVLDAGRAASMGIRLRRWQAALDEDLRARA
jgi:dTDP-4-dehydrorhamnose reductase